MTLVETPKYRIVPDTFRWNSIVFRTSTDRCLLKKKYWKFWITVDSGTCDELCKKIFNQ